MSTIKWGQRCIARRFEAVEEGVASLGTIKQSFVGKECIVIGFYKKESARVSFEDDNEGGFIWPISALEPIPETPSVWWPEIGEEVMYEGQVKTVTDTDVKTHQLDNDKWVNVTNLSPVTTTEITPEEAVKLLEQHTGKSFTIKSK
jgi:hypothetical protein